MKPINLIFDIKRDMHDYVELMQGYSYSFECEFYDDGIEFDLTGYNMSVDMLLANGDYDFRVSNKVVIGNKVTFNTDVISDYTGDAKLQILLEKSGVYTGSWLVNCKVKPSVLNEVKNTDFVTDLKQTIQEGKDLYDKGGVATKQDIAEVNTQLSQKPNSLDVRYKSDKILLSDLSTEVKESMTGGSVGVVGESSVNFENLTEDCVRGFNIRGSRVGRNKLDVMSVTPNYTVDWQNGEPLAYDGCAISDFIPCLPSTAYYYSYRQNVAFYDNNKVYISGIPLPNGLGMEFTTPDNARYIRVGLASATDSQGNKLWNTFYLCELNELQEFEPYVESSPYEYDLFQKENSSITIEKDNRGRIVNIAETIGNKTTNTYISYGQNGAISNITENNGEYESTITVSKNLIERKVKTLKGVY